MWSQCRLFGELPKAQLICSSRGGASRYCLARQGLERPAVHTPFIFHFPSCPCTVHLTMSAPTCPEACVLLRAEFLEVSATPPPYGACPSLLTLLPFLSVQRAAREHQENGAWRKGLCCTACLWPRSQSAGWDWWPDSVLSARAFLWVCAKPQASLGQTPLAIPVCSEVPTSEFLVSGRKQHGGDGQHL